MLLATYFVLRARDNKYYCKRCTDANQMRDEEERTTVTFNARDAGVLARIDDFVSMEFPFVPTKKAAMSKNLVHSLSDDLLEGCLLYTSPSPRDQRGSRMPSSA